MWFLFYPAVFFSSWIGGLPGGLLATFISTALVWWFFIPPINSFAWEDPKALISVAVFMGMGVLFSISHGCLRKANKQAAEALEVARSANDLLQTANEKITGLYEKTRELNDLKTQFFANVSHELSTSLTLILGPVRKRLASPDLTEEERQDLGVVDRNARLLYRHVSDLLDVAKIEAGRMVMDYAQVDLARLHSDQRTHLLPVVILTSSDEERDRLRSYQSGANSFVRKPLDFAEFAETVAHLGVYWLAINKPPLE